MPSTVRRVVVCEAQVPFVSGGAERLARTLVAELRRRGHDATIASVPFKWYPKDELLAQAAAWELVDLSESNGERIDLAIATKFPTYFVRHPCKVTWLLHQYRAVYDLFGTPYSDFAHTERDVRLRDRLIALDTEALGASARLFTISGNTAARVTKYNGLAATPLYPPSPLTGRLRAGEYGDYVLSVGRLEANKRVDLVVRALAHVDRPTRLVIVGDGPLRSSLEATAQAAGVGDRVTFTRADDATLIDLYAGALAVVFPPFDEDYGYVTIEAFLARKPVITTTDAGGPLEFVEHDATGCVVAPDPQAIGAAIARLAANRRLAADLGESGFARASAITWDGVIDRLVGDPAAVA